MDAGSTWQHLGLEDTQHIAKIVIDPMDPNTVYVAAAGHAYTPNVDRGGFKTTDGGRTWTKSLYANDRAAAIDLVMDPKNPKILYAAVWRRNLRAQGEPPPVPGAQPVIPVNEYGGIYKTIDGGKNWVKCVSGLPATRVGGIGLAMYLEDPNIVYAILDNQTPTRHRKPRLPRLPMWLRAAVKPRPMGAPDGMVVVAERSAQPVLVPVKCQMLSDPRPGQPPVYFELAGIPPGEYRACLVENPDRGLWWNRQFFQQVVGMGKAVTVTENGSVRLEAPLLSGQAIEDAIARMGQ